MNKQLYLILFLLLKTITIFGSSSGADFLLINPDATSLSLGGATTANEAGSCGGIRNIAALASSSNRMISFSVLPWIGETIYGSATFIEPIKKSPGFTIGFDFKMFSSLDIENIDIGGNVLNNISLNDFVASFLVSFPIPLNGLSGGSKVSFIARDLYDYRVFGVSFSLSLFYKVSFLSFYSLEDKNLQLGFIVENFGPELFYNNSSLSSQNKKLPTLFNWGLKYRFINTSFIKFSFLADYFSNTALAENGFRLGLIYNFFNTITLRSGYEYKSDLRSFSFGLGVKLSLGDTIFLVDYSFFLLKYEIGEIHSVSLSMEF